MVDENSVFSSKQIMIFNLIIILGTTNSDNTAVNTRYAALCSTVLWTLCYSFQINRNAITTSLELPFRITTRLRNNVF